MDFVILYWHWIVFGIFLIVAEMFLVSFTILWFGTGAVLVGILTFFLPQISFPIQITLWALSSFLITLFWFLFVKPRFGRKKLTHSNRTTIIGQIGLVLNASAIEDTQEHTGRLRFPAPLLGDDEWDFLCHDMIQTGDRVKVIDSENQQLIVKKT